MKIAITDACIFIDLFELDIVDHFFKLDMEVHTSADVLNELDSQQQEALKGFIASSKFTYHVLSGEELKAINASDYPKALSNSDKTVLFLAENMDAVLLSSDKLVRNTARKKGIDYHGLLWILDRLKEHTIITAEKAIEKINMLMGYSFYRNNEVLLAEMRRRLREYGDHPASNNE